MNKACTVLKGGTLIDGTGAQPIRDAVVVMRGERIESVGTARSAAIPPDATLIDATGKTVMPGLIDSHIHLWGMKDTDFQSWLLEPEELKAIRAVPDLALLLDSGFTTVRDCANANSHHLQRALNEGNLPGPRLVHCGKIICQTGGHGDLCFGLPVEHNKKVRIADGPDDCRKAVREQFRNDASFIKIATSGGYKDRGGPLADPRNPQFTEAEIRAIVDEAHRFGAKVSAHAALGVEAIKRTVRCGVDIIEHGAELDDEAVELMISKGTYLVPTLHIAHKFVTVGWMGMPQELLEKNVEIGCRSFEKAWKAGVKIGCGTDTISAPHLLPVGESASELVLQVKAGRPVLDVIASATKINAEILGLDQQLGTITAGKIADILVVDGDPCADIRILQDRKRIRDIFKSGIRAPRLDSTLWLPRWE